jgi:hypothetical protein
VTVRVCDRRVCRYGGEGEARGEWERAVTKPCGVGRQVDVVGVGDV